MTEAARKERLGLICGVLMALAASLSFASARAGIFAGLKPADMVFARFLVAGAITLPFLIRWGVVDLAGIGWRRGLVLLALGGPGFALLQTGGYAYAPLAHGAVIAPATVTVISTILAAVALHKRLGRAHLVGAAIILAGIGFIGWDGITGPSQDGAWIGDLLFFLSSVLWAVFTLLLRRWRLDALRATAVVGVLSMLAMTPIYLLWFGGERLAPLPLGALALQGIVQGGLQGVLTMIAYGLLVGIPIVGEIPGGLQIGGLVLVTTGLLVTTGILQRWIQRRRRR